MDIGKLKERMQKFCATGDGRYAIHHPWVAGGEIRATDGRIAARCKCDEPDTVPENGVKYPDFSTIGFDAKLYGEPVELPDAPKPTTRRCESCRGTGTWECDCPDCSGFHDCESCDGKGEWIDHGHPIKIGDGVVFLVPRYVALLRSDGVTHVRPKLKYPASSPVYTEHDGIEYLLMPVRTDAQH